MEKKPRGPLFDLYYFLSSSSLSSMLLLVLFYIFVAVPTAPVNAATSSAPPTPTTFTPQDKYFIDCGATSQTTLPDGRVFSSDNNSTQYLKSKSRDIQVSTPKADVPLPIYLTAKVFVSEATYTFHMARPGYHWVRLYFYPVSNKEFNLQTAKFSVNTDTLVLLHEFSLSNANNWVLKEYLVNVTTERFSIKFVPDKGSSAFINAIEVVSAPDILIPDTGSSLSPVAQINGLAANSYQTVYRLNMGGPEITSDNDTLGRTWATDEQYLKDKEIAKSVSVAPSVIKYPQAGSPLIAPPSVYASAQQMGDAKVGSPNFNVTWNLNVDTAYGYLVRLHFCDIVSKSLNDLYFNVYINGKTAISGLDLSSVTEGGLATPYYKDIIVNGSVISSPLSIQIGPMNQDTGTKNAIINGLEVLKMNNSVNSLDGEFGVDGKSATNASKGTVAAVGFAMMFGALVGLGAMAVKWQKRPRDWQKSKSFSSWLLPLHAGDSSYMSRKNSSRKTNFYSSTMGLGRYFSFAELQDATNDWDPNAVIGVGGFGNVYIGEIDDGSQVAIKRGNPQSEQGINEFQTEIQMLSKLRHRHLVSLIGYCDENSEMILVYEYMSNGPLRDHLYGKDLTLTWKQRLEICIGAARGLHYLHTGATQGIIHRDVKTTNILLDDQFIAKMADFGLSKDAPTTEQTHVSTAVKGSFGYLDPEYFRKQQLTDKSDVYSFGVVLLEVLCARPPINPGLPRDQVNLAEWAMLNKRRGTLEKIMDPLLVNVINPESMKKFTEAAEKCLAEYGVDRPTMGDVLWNLEYALQLQEASSQGKAEEENKGLGATTSPGSPATVAPAPAAASDNRPISSPEANRNPAEVPIDAHSGTAMFQQFGSLNGR
ncbi:probable receptor-like protein kinase At2g21480 [Cornus florida]|uniref:probable receptor-like protein kinase At2g21480 n=1 Tax=Cornus florida TaxID=4283 RepID=UPI002899814A|nr:probable receptor-like protein kinase At2g21480 [Cornus florida]